MQLRVVGPHGERVSICGDGFVNLAEMLERQAQRAARPHVGAAQPDGLAKRQGRLRIALLLEQRPAEIE